MERSLNGGEIKRLLPKIKIVTYESLKNADDIDELLYPSGAFILLYQIASTSYGHWCAVFVRDDTLCFYDSYAMKPDDPKRLDYASEELIAKLYKTHAYLAELMKNSRYKKIDYNEYRQQAAKTVTCGRHCVCRVWLRSFDNKQYDNFIRSTDYSPDEYVTVLTENALEGFPFEIKKLY